MRRLKKIGLFIVAECFKALFRLLMFALVVYVVGKIISMETKQKPLEHGTYIELKLENVALNKAQIDELSTKLKEFKMSGKKIYAYAPSFNNNNYLIASVADKVVMPATMGAMSELKGYFVEIPYYRALGDKVGIRMNVIHVGDYKSAGESYERTEMSKEFKENTERIYNKVYNNFVETISQNRKLDKNIFNERILSGDFVLADPETMKRYGLIDEIAYYENFLAENQIANKIGLKEYVSRLSVDEVPKDEKVYPKIAVIYAEGTINYYEDNKELGETVTPERIQKELAIAEANPDIKGIVIRINSPGGSALASDIIYNSIKQMTKPVYISMGGVAASGGYYIAAAGEKIYADKETVTGSIGVVTMIPNTAELMKKLSINYETISKGKYSDLASANKEMTADEREKIYASSLKVYNEFVDRVSEGRNMNREDVLKIAEGRVWLGQEAKEIGLVDEIGGIEKAVADLAKSLGLQDYKTVESLKEEKIESVIKNYLPKYLMAKVIDEDTAKIVEKIKEDNVINEELLYKPVLYAPNTDIK